MKVSQAEFQNMKEEIVKDMISRLMEERRLSLQQAFDAVYTSRLFEKLSNPNTGLFFQSSGYVYSYLLEELDGNNLLD
jgi:ClpP class serine protease